MFSLFNISTTPRGTFACAPRGFGLVELMISVSIMVLLSGVILARHSAFNGAVLLRNQAYEVAFALRQAQLLAVSGVNTGATTKVQQYGVRFSEVANQNNSYFIFHDQDADGAYDESIDEKIETFQIDKRFDIREVTGSSAIMNITFKRPNFDAIFVPPVPSSAGSIFIDIAKIDTTDTKVSTVRRVEVTTAGNISVTKY